LIIFDLDDTIYDRTGQLSDDLKELKEISVFPGVFDFLQQKEVTKVLVTKGNEEIQNQKIDVLKIRNYFNKIYICKTDEEKIGCFRDAKKHCLQNEKIWVVGNRIDSEIQAGNKLGLKTILLKHGKYKSLKAKNKFEVPDYKIFHFWELNKIIKCKQ